MSMKMWDGYPDIVGMYMAVYIGEGEGEREGRALAMAIVHLGTAHLNLID